MKNNNLVKILYFIQLPPPVHGVSLINQQIYHSEKINRGIEKSLLEIKFSDQLSVLRKFTFKKILQLMKLSFKLISRIKKFRPDYIYFSLMPVGKGFWRDLIFILIIKSLKITPIYHLHNKGIKNASGIFLMRWLYRFVFRNSIVIHLSPKLLVNEIEFLGAYQVKTNIIPYGIMREEVEDNRGKDNYFKILFLSNLFPGKGFKELVEVFHKISHEESNIFLTIAGGYPDYKTEKYLRKQILEYGLENRIFLAGPVYNEGKTKLYSEADLFVFPTFFSQECFPQVILEAMQAGLPIITTKEGAIPEIIDHEINGIIINQRDNIALENQIRRLINEKELRNKLGTEARKKFYENYTLEHFEKNMRDFFEQELLITN